MDLQHPAKLPRVKTSLLPLAIAVAGLARPAFAEERAPVKLAWSAPPECPGVATVVAEVEKVLGAAPRRAAVATASVEKVAEGRWSVHIETDAGGVKGDRSLEAASCASIASATALIVAWTMEAGRPLEAPPPPPVPAIPPPPAPPTPPPPLKERAQVRPATRVHALVAVSGALDLGTLPSLGAGGEVTLGVVAGRARFELEGGDWGSENATAGASSGTLKGQGTTLHLWEARLRGCVRAYLSPRFELGPCLAGGLSYVTSHGFNESVPQNASTAWPTLEPGVLGRLRVWGPFSLRAGLSAEIPLARPPFVIVRPDGTSFTVHTSGLAAGRAAFGVEAQFP